MPPTSTAHLDVASALPDDLDDEFGSSDSLYDSYNMNNGGEDWDDYNNYLYAQQQHAGAAATAGGAEGAATAGGGCCLSAAAAAIGAIILSQRRRRTQVKFPKLLQLASCHCC